MSLASHADLRLSWGWGVHMECLGIIPKPFGNVWTNAKGFLGLTRLYMSVKWLKKLWPHWTEVNVILLIWIMHIWAMLQSSTHFMLVMLIPEWTQRWGRTVFKCKSGLMMKQQKCKQQNTGYRTEEIYHHTAIEWQDLTMNTGNTGVDIHRG